MKPRHFFSLCFTFAAIISGCKVGSLPVDNNIVDKSSTTEKSIQDHLLAHYNFLNQTFEADGVISLQSFTTFPMQNSSEYSDAIGSASFLGTQKALVESVKLSNISLPKITDGVFKTKEVLAGGVSLKHLYGQNLNLQVKNISESENQFSLYLPKMMKLNINVDEGFKYDLQAGNIIKWNKDESNNNGVVFIIEYDPDLNPSVAKKEKITKIFSSDDVGTYTIKAEDTADLPKQANVKIMVGRAGFKSVESSGKVYAIYGFSIVAVGGIVK